MTGLEAHSLHQSGPALNRSVSDQSTQHAKVRGVIVRLVRASVPVRGLVALEHGIALFLRADVIGQAAGLDQRSLVLGDIVLGDTVFGDVVLGHVV